MTNWRVYIKLNEFMVFVSANFLNIEEVEKTPKKVFVLTQERLQEAMANNPLTNVDLLVVDEAQKISDDSRGVIIEDAVQELIAYNPTVQKVVISPYAQNPERFRLVFNIQDEVIPERTSKSPVGQNFFFVNFEEKKLSVSLLSWELEVPEEVKVLQEITTKSLPKPKYKRKAWVVNNLVAEGEPTIVYCDRPSDCRRVAENMAEGSEKAELSDELRKAVEFFSEYVHKEYYLCDSLRNKIGYHYGKMPQFVRFYVKNLFEKKEIDLLCCTSTLLEGVNLPAKNIVLYNPKAGKVMDRLSLLNLAGRAGRLLKDYYGKIYCINMGEWESGEDVFREKLEEIESSVEQTLSKDADSLVKYLEDMNYNPPEEKLKERVKALATSLLMKQLKYPDSLFLENFRKRNVGISQDIIETIRKLLIRDTSQILLNKEVILKNRSIDPRFQNELYLDLKHGFMPLPFPSDFYFYKKICKIFQKISKYIFREHNVRYAYFAYLAWRWILEDPYKSLIEGKIRKKKENAGRLFDTNYKTFVNRVIDELDDDIETMLKYNYTRALKCYLDISEEIRHETGDRRASCRELPIFLEEGTSNRNTLFLLEAGLSRNVAITIASLMRDTKINDSAQSVEWLRLNKKRIQGELSEILYMEIEELLAKYGTN